MSDRYHACLILLDTGHAHFFIIAHFRKIELKMISIPEQFRTKMHAMIYITICKLKQYRTLLVPHYITFHYFYHMVKKSMILLELSRHCTNEYRV